LRAAVQRALSDSSALIEPLKWLALLLMLAEHWMRYAVGDLPAWLFACGRVAFPLFVFAVALGLRDKPCTKLVHVLFRMLVWAAVAQATIQLVDAPENRLNVLFTFAFGLAAAHAVGCIGSPLLVAIMLAAIGTVSLWCEFGLVGVAFVAGCTTIARAGDRPLAAWIAVLALLALLAIPNGNHFALAAVPVAYAVAWLPLRVPRLRGAFYWAYALQFPVYAAARALLA